MRNLFAIAVLLAGATALRADVFQFSYSGGTLSVNGTVTGTGGNPYTVTNIVGYYGSTAISNNIGNNDGSFYYAGVNSYGNFDFLVNGQLELLFFAPGGFYIEDSVGNKLFWGDNFSISVGSVPEAGTVSLLASMGLGMLVLARKLPRKARSAS